MVRARGKVLITERLAPISLQLLDSNQRHSHSQAWTSLISWESLRARAPHRKEVVMVVVLRKQRRKGQRRTYLIQDQKMPQNEKQKVNNEFQAWREIQNYLTGGRALHTTIENPVMVIRSSKESAGPTRSSNRAGLLSIIVSGAAVHMMTMIN